MFISIVCTCTVCTFSMHFILGCNLFSGNLESFSEVKYSWQLMNLLGAKKSFTQNMPIGHGYITCVETM